MDNSINNIDKPNFNFSKGERLCSKKTIDKLFLEGKSIFSFPVKIVWLETALTVNYPVQAAFSVSKRNFRRAVQRNLIKRRMREAYRLNKNVFYNRLCEKQVAVFFIFTAKTISEYSHIETAIKKGMNKLLNEITAANQ